MAQYRYEFSFQIDTTITDEQIRDYGGYVDLGQVIEPTLAMQTSGITMAAGTNAQWAVVTGRGRRSWDAVQRELNDILEDAFRQGQITVPVTMITHKIWFLPVSNQASQENVEDTYTPPPAIPADTTHRDLYLYDTHHKLQIRGRAPYTVRRMKRFTNDGRSDGDEGMAVDEMNV